MVDDVVGCTLELRVSKTIYQISTWVNARVEVDRLFSYS
jgi:hypothetical protein